MGDGLERSRRGERAPEEGQDWAGRGGTGKEVEIIRKIILGYEEDANLFFESCVGQISKMVAIPISLGP